YDLARSQIAICICLMFSMFALAWSFVTDDYTNQYVWQHSDKSMSVIYKLTAIWGGMDGSMLLWGFMLSVSSALAALQAPHYSRKLAPWVLCVLHGCCLFFLTLLVFYTNPFRYLKADFIPPDGNGLNPLLQNPYMAIHPPMLYLGFTTFTVPFAFCMGALLSGVLTNEWLRLSRTWTLVAWSFLTLGIVLGGHWAYIELGWGGFWAWDPVENASFLPWLTGTAYLHSVMVQERKNMLKFWNVWLIVITFSLTVFGTFLTRSGVVQSVHAFASTDIGPVFLYFLALVLAMSVWLSILRRKDLASERHIESIFSREAAFLLNNLIFLSICFATLWGVLFPVFSEYFTGVKRSVGIPFFNTVNVPLFLFLILLMGIGPMIAWRKANLTQIRRTLLMPFAYTCGLAVVLMWAGVDRFYPLLSYCLCFFVVMSIMAELYRGMKAQRSGVAGKKSLPESLVQLLRRHRDRYAGYLVHFGVAVMTISITASMAHKIEQEFSLKLNETVSVGRFNFTLTEVKEYETKAYAALRATMTVAPLTQSAKSFVVHPEVRQYVRKRETTTEVALRMGLREDVYVVLAGTDETGERASFKVFINPLQVWLWIGTLITLGGALVLIIP
ncbi:MAG: heme lyase CcmF/NrfE family subunit, partial [Bdellovibrionales bacterium]|nr:heme lyase CcmF/NrfE family subunit [Bdellovibrionales bacterium]